MGIQASKLLPSLMLYCDSDSRKWYAHITFDVSEKAVRGVWRKVPLMPKGNLRVGIDIGINNLFAVYAEGGRVFLVNGRLLKSISHYWRTRIAEYQSMLNKYGLRTSRKLRVMYKKWRRQVEHYINTAVRGLAENYTMLVYLPFMLSAQN